MPLETSITKSIVTAATKRGWWSMKIHGGPFQKSGVPDLLLVKNGLAVFLEVKRPGGKTSAIQDRRISEIRTVGGAVAEVVTSREQAERILTRWDQ